MDHLVRSLDRFLPERYLFSIIEEKGADHFGPKIYRQPRGIGAAAQSGTTGEQRHTIVETGYDYGQKAEADDCACR